MDEFARENQALKAKEKELQEAIETENKHLRGVDADIQRTGFEIDRLRDACSSFLVFEHLLREFLRVGSPERQGRAFRGPPRPQRTQNRLCQAL